MRMIYAAAVAAALTLGACNQTEAERAEDDVEDAMQDTGRAFERAGDEMEEGAREAGEAIENTTNDAAGATERATDDNPATTP